MFSVFTLLRKEFPPQATIFFINTEAASVEVVSTFTTLWSGRISPFPLSLAVESSLKYTAWSRVEAQPYSVESIEHDDALSTCSPIGRTLSVSRLLSEVVSLKLAPLDKFCS